MQRSKLKCFLSGKLRMVWDWRGREEQVCGPPQDRRKKDEDEGG